MAGVVSAVTAAAAAASSFFSFLGFCLSFLPKERLLRENSRFTLSFLGFFADDPSPPSVPASDTLLSFRLSLALLSDDSAASSLAGDVSAPDASPSAAAGFSSAVAVSFSVDLSFSFSTVSAAAGVADSVVA